MLALGQRPRNSVAMQTSAESAFQSGGSSEGAGGESRLQRWPFLGYESWGAAPGSVKCPAPSALNKCRLSAPLFDSLHVNSDCYCRPGHCMSVMRILLSLWEEIPHARRHSASSG